MCLLCDPAMLSCLTFSSILLGYEIPALERTLAPIFINTSGFVR